MEEFQELGLSEVALLLFTTSRAYFFLWFLVYRPSSHKCQEAHPAALTKHGEAAETRHQERAGFHCGINELGNVQLSTQLKLHPQALFPPPHLGRSF